MLELESAQYLAARDTLARREAEDEFELNDILQFTAATIVDVAVTAADSLTFGAFDLNTKEALDGFGAGLGLGEYYEQHREGIELASFVGGLVAPGMAAAKALKFARKATGNPFNTISTRVSDFKAQALELTETAGAQSDGVREAIRSARLWTVGEGVAESMVYEAGFALFMNQHAYMDNSYSAGDAALGVALGSIMGPLKLISLNKEIRTGQRQIVEKQVKDMLFPAKFQSIDKGDQLGFIFHRLQQVENVDPSKLSAELQGAQTVAGEAMQLFGLKQIRSMGTEGFKELSAVKQEKVGLVSALGKQEKIWDAAGPDSIVYQLAAANPKAFLGVNKFGIYNSDNIFDAFVGAVREGEGGVQIIRDSKTARDLLFHKQITKKVDPDLTSEKLRNQIPEGLVLDESSDTILITTKKKLGNKDRQWVADYLGLPKSLAKEFRLAGPAGKFHIDNEALRAEGITNHLTYFETASTPWTKAVDELNVTTNGAILHPHFPGHAISAAEAASAQTVSMSKSVKVNQASKFGITNSYKPFEVSSAQVDASWLDALWAAKNEKVIGKDLLVNELDLPKIQALLIRHAEEKAKAIKANTGTPDWPIFKLSTKEKGKTRNITSEAIAITHLKEQKLRLLGEGIDQGYSTQQMAVILNMPSNTIDDLIAQGKQLDEINQSGIVTYNTLEPVKYERAPVIHLQGNSPMRGATEEYNLGAMLDENVAAAAHRQTVNVVLNTIQSRGGELSEMLATIFHSPVMRELEDNLSAAIANIDSRNVLFSSTDHALRGLGKLGDHISTLSQDFNTLVNKQIGRFKEELTGTMASVAGHPASATQFALLRQAVHSHSIDDAVNFVFDAKEGVIVKNGRQIKQAAVEGVKLPEADLLRQVGSDTVIRMTPQLKAFMTVYEPVMKESLGLHQASVLLNGQGHRPGAGVWFPYDPIQEEFIGYKMRMRNGKVDTTDIELVVANTAKELEGQIIKLTEEAGSDYRVVTRKNASDFWNQIHGFAELEQLRVADISRRKAGLTSGQAVPGNYEMSRFMQTLTNDTWAKHRRIFRAANGPMFDQLDFAARQASSAAESTGVSLASKVQRKTSTSELVSNVLLGRSMMKNTPMMDMANNMTKVLVNTALNTTGRLWQDFRGETGGILKGKKAEAAWVKHAKELEKEGIESPYKDVSEYMIALAKSNNLDMAQHKIAAAQSILVTLNLRFLEAAHAMVTVASLPVIMTGELSHLNKTAGGKYPLKMMVDAIKFMSNRTNPESLSIMKYGHDMGHTKGIVAETTELLADLHTNATFLDKHKKLVDTLSKPSDAAENFAREFSYSLGYQIAKTRWPGSSRELLLSHAAAFTKRTMGNYASKQKPTLFQGAFGSMVGLYQTFMLTMGQNLFRYAEHGDKAAIAKMLAAQSGMFGMEALPFFQDFNQALGEYASDEHNDIRTTAYKVFGDTDDKSTGRAEFLLFGLPSTVFGAGLYTRGALAPRGPLNFSGERGFSFKPALLDAAIQATNVAWDTAGSMKTAITTGGSIADMGEAALQGLAAQSLWRPGARTAELMMGRSFDRKGELISGPGEVQEPFAIMSRVLSMRPLQEQAMRNLKFQSSYYEGVDRARRQKVIRQVRRMASDGEPMENVDQLHLAYMEEGGSMSGWSDIMKKSYQASGTSYAYRLSEYAKKNPAIVEIAEMYGQ